jgi:hypothetical protein
MHPHSLASRQGVWDVGDLRGGEERSLGAGACEDTRFVD